MPTPAYLTVEGKNQGRISQGAFTQASVGNIYVEGHEDEILVQSFHHGVTLPRDPQSGQPSGQRVHDSLIVVKVFDKSSPLLYQALTAGERLTQVKLKWYRSSSIGRQEHYFTMDLEDAILVNITARMHNCQDTCKAHFTHLEALEFTYRKISWTHETAGTSASDDWRVPRK